MKPSMGGSITGKGTRDALEWKHSDLKKFTEECELPENTEGQRSLS